MLNIDSLIHRKVQTSSGVYGKILGGAIEGTYHHTVIFILLTDNRIVKYHITDLTIVDDE